MTIAQAFQLGLQQHRAGRLAEAESYYRQILAAVPSHSDALHHLGIIAFQLHAGGPLEVRYKDLEVEVNPKSDRLKTADP